MINNNKIKNRTLHFLDLLNCIVMYKIIIYIVGIYHELGMKSIYIVLHLKLNIFNVLCKYSDVVTFDSNILNKQTM